MLKCSCDIAGLLSEGSQPVFQRPLEAVEQLKGRRLGAPERGGLQGLGAGESQGGVHRLGEVIRRMGPSVAWVETGMGSRAAIHPDHQRNGLCRGYTWPRQLPGRDGQLWSGVGVASPFWPPPFACSFSKEAFPQDSGLP